MKLTISGLARAEKCPVSAVLPSVVEPASIYADRGRAVHQFLQRVGEGKEQALAQVPEQYREFCESIELTGLPHVESQKWSFEVPMAWNWETGDGRVLPGAGERNYGEATSSELPGTADILGLTEESVVVLDLKTGFGWLGDPSINAQLLGYAVLAAATWKKKSAVVGFIFVDGDGATRTVTRFVDEPELREAESRVRKIIDASLAEEMLATINQSSQPTVGEHCKYCPAFLRCPAQVSLLKGVVDVEVIREEDMPVALLRIEAIEAALKKAQAIIDTWAKSHPIRLPDGQIYGQRERHVEQLNAEIGHAVLAEKYGATVAEAAIEAKLVLTKSALKEALRPLRTKECGITKLEAEAVDAIAKAGGVSVKTTVSLSKFKPPKQLE